MLRSLSACVISGVVAKQTPFREPDHRQLWPMAGVSGLALIWASCEVMWHQAATPETALCWARLSSLGTARLGPVGLHAFAIGSNKATPRIRRCLPWLYAGAIPLLALRLFGEGVIESMLPTRWGGSPQTGPWLGLY